MANHTQVYGDKFNIEEVSNTINDINLELFDNLLNIKIEDDSIRVVISEFDKISIWLVDEPYYIHSSNTKTKLSDRYLDIRHGHSLQFSWWLDYLITCELANRLGGTCVGEGYKYPDKCYKYSENFATYMENRYNKHNKSIIEKIIMEMSINSEIEWTLREVCPKLFKHCINMK